MAIIYALVARQDVILAHYSTTTGDFINVASMLLKKLALSSTPQATYVHDRYIFNLYITYKIYVSLFV